jgi:hypothetical protein
MPPAELRLSVGKDDLMASLRDSLIARRRRLESRVNEVRAALESSDRSGVADAIAGALDALYDLWEYWQKRAGLTMTKPTRVSAAMSTVRLQQRPSMLAERRPTSIKSSDASRILTEMCTAPTTESGAGKTTQILARALPPAMTGTSPM